MTNSRHNPTLLLILIVLAAVSLPVRADDTAMGYRNVTESIPEELVPRLELQMEADQLLLRRPECLFRDLVNLQPVAKRLERLSTARECEWEVDLSQGIEADFSHLFVLRQAAAVLDLQARARLARGDRAGFGDALISLIRIARHAGPDSLISSLVAIALIDQAHTLIDLVQSQGQLDAELAARITAALTLFDDEDPFRLAGAFEFERVCGQILLDRFFTTRGTDQPLHTPEERDELRRQLQEDGINPKDVEWIAQGRARIEADFSRFWRDLDRILEARDTLDMVAVTERLEAAVERGDYGGFNQLFSTALVPTLVKNQTAMNNLTARREALIRLRDGQTPPPPPHNAAIMYHKIATITDHQPVGWSDDPTTRSNIHRLVRLATAIDHCQFPSPEALAEALSGTMGLAWNPPVIPWWLPYLDALIEDSLLVFDTAFDRNDRPLTVDQLDIGITIIGHLAKDPHIASSLVAAWRCGQVLDRIDQLANQGLSPSEATRLLERLRQIPTGDPFGIRKATERTRRRVAFHLDALAQGGVLGTYPVPSTPTGLLYTTAWLYDLPATKSGIPAALSECVWPDGEAGMTCPPFDSDSIQTAQSAGKDALRAWTVGVQIPLEPVPLAKVGLEQTLEDARIRVRDHRQRLRDLISVGARDRAVTTE